MCPDLTSFLASSLCRRDPALRNTGFCATAVLLSVALLPRAQAQTPAVSTPAVSFAPGFTGIESTAATEGVASYNLGYRFSVNAPVIVTQLGYFADTAYGSYTTTHAVGLYSSTGILLLSGTVSQSDPLSGFFRYTAPSLPGFVLLPGQGYILSGVTGADDPFLEDVQDQAGTTAPFRTAPQFNYGGSVSAVGSTLAANNFQSSSLSDPGLFGPNFQFLPQATPVPEASTLVSTGLLLGLGAVAFYARRRRSV